MDLPVDAERNAAGPQAVAARRHIPGTVHGAALLFLATMIGFLVLYPTFYGFDEPQHVDRIYATTDGDLLPDPGELLAAAGIARAQNTYVETWPYMTDHSYVNETEVPRDDRPSLIDLGGHATTPPGGYSNQLSEHPPAYYWLMGAVMWAVPGDASLPVDVYVFVLRCLNILLLVPLPYVFWWGAQRLFGAGWAAQTAAFVPALIPGLARVGASVNNDNLVTLTATAILALIAGVTRGDFSMRTGRRLALLLVLALLTKGSALVLPPVVFLSYLVGWARVRGPLPWRPLLLSSAGSVVGGMWWVGNLLRFGAIRPNGYGNRLERVQGPLRAATDPAQWDTFVDYLKTNLPERFWGDLGLIEPPTLPGWTVTTLNVFLIVALLVTLVFAHRFRASVAVLSLAALLTGGLMVANSWSYYQDFTVIPGVQGRYFYPFLLGPGIAIACAVAFVLGPLKRIAPLVLLFGALGTSYLGASAVVAWIWLPTGQEPRPGNVDLAFDTIARFAPFSPPVTATLLGLVVLVGVAAFVLTLRGVIVGLPPPASPVSDGVPRTLEPAPVA